MKRLLFVLISTFCLGAMACAQNVSELERRARARETEAESLYGLWLIEHGQEEEGLRWLHMAAGMGDLQAKYNIGVYYVNKKRLLRKQETIRQGNTLV